MEILEKFFNFFDNTMSIHLREDIKPMAKHGKPGQWKLENISETILSKEVLLEYTQLIQEYSHDDEKTFFEEENEMYNVIQLRNYRIVIVFPPFSDVIELTIVRPTTTRSLSEYKLSNKLYKRLENRAEGILIAGAPGHGKSTFASSLAMFYADQSKIVKTIEKPRDLQLDNRITQFTMIKNDSEKVGDLLLLMRPDYVIYDEIRKNSDFEIYSDMRLAGVGMVGVIHATKPIDSIQRFVTRIELGLIPSIIDTVIFVKFGEVNSILSLKIVVKTPKGFNDQSLARPVIEVSDFDKGYILYEIFSFGEQIVVIPIKNTQQNNNIQKKSLYKDIVNYLISNYHELNNNNITINKIDRYNISIYVPDKYVNQIQNDNYLLEIIRDEYKVELFIKSTESSIQYELYQTKKELIIVPNKKLSNRDVELSIGSYYSMRCKVNRNGEIILNRKKATTKRLEKLLDNSDNIMVIKE